MKYVSPLFLHHILKLCVITVGQGIIIIIIIIIIVVVGPSSRAV